MELIHDELVSAVWPHTEAVSAREYRNRQLLESALGRPFHSAGGQDAYSTIIEKAAALFHALIANHPFHNGNKRTAVLSMHAFLMGNGYSLALDNDRMYELAQDTASYREREVSHDDQLAKIMEILDECSVELDVLRYVRVSDREMRRKLTTFYKTQLKMGRSVRRHPANTLLDS